MRYLSLVLAVLVSFAVSVGSAIAQPTVPKLKGPVNDYANILSASEVENLSASLLAQEKQTSNQIVVLVVDSLNGESVESFAHKVFNTWELGKKKEINKDGNTGVLLLIAVKDRKMRIEVGYGLEPTLTDGIAGEIIRNDIGPSFKDKKYYDGILAGTNKITQVVAGTYVSLQAKGGNQPAPAAAPSGRTSSLVTVAVVLYVLLFIFCKCIPSKFALVGGIVGGLGVFGISLLILSFWGAFGLGVLGFFVGVAAAAGSELGGRGGGGSYRSYSSSGSSSSRRSSWSSGSGGGSRSSSGSSGGYSGGGGRSGGGGASGSW